MSSVTDLINLAQFDLQQGYGPSKMASEGMQKISAMLEKMNIKRRQHYTQLLSLQDF